MVTVFGLVVVVDDVGRRLVGLEGRRFGLGLGIDLGFGMEIGMWFPTLLHLFGPYFLAVLVLWLCRSERN